MRLVVALLLLVTVALATSGLVASATLRSYQIERIDAPLKSAAQPTQEHGTGILGGSSGHGDGSGADGLFSNFVTEVTDADGKTSVPLSQNLVDPRQPLPKMPRFWAARLYSSYIFKAFASRFGAPWPDDVAGIGTFELALFAAVSVEVHSRQPARVARALTRYSGRSSNESDVFRIALARPPLSGSRTKLIL